jgi:hypothetical protein
VTQVARGVGPGAASHPGIALPVRIHDLLLTMAGRLDDDALADARQMLASAELDRSLEFLAGCLVAGRVVLTHDQHAELAALFDGTYLDSAVIDRIMVTDRLNVGRHRFAFGPVDGRDPERGVADAVRSVLGVLPDVRSMWCVWRLSPAGPASGPVPHLLVLVGIGPGGFPPATAYRVEDALRRNGIRASVEVLMDGVEPGEYHREAMRNARQIPFDGPGFNRPRVEPAYEAARIAPARVEAPRMSAAPEPPRLEPARVTSVPQEPIEPPRVESPRPESRSESRRAESRRAESFHTESFHAEPQHDEPYRVESHRVDSHRADSFRADSYGGDSHLVEPDFVEPDYVEPHRVEPDYADHRVEPDYLEADFVEPRGAEPRGADARSADSRGVDPHHGESHHDEPARVEPPRPEPRQEPARAEAPQPVHVESLRSEPVPPRMSVVRNLPPAVDAPRIDTSEVPVRKDPPFSDEESPAEQTSIDPPTIMSAPVGGVVGPGGLVGGGEEELPPPVEAVRKDPFRQHEQDERAEMQEPPADVRPSPLPRRRPEESPQDPPSRPRLAPAPVQSGGVDKHSQAFVDDILNTQERNLLKELQDELARREQQDPPPQANNSGSWRVDRSGRHGKPATAGPFDHPNQTTGPMIINGVPPHDRGYPPNS